MIVVPHDQPIRFIAWMPRRLQMKSTAAATSSTASIVRATGAVFKPAVPVTLEGGLYAFAGMLIFLGLYHLLLSRWIAPRTRTRAAPMSHNK